MPHIKADWRHYLYKLRRREIELLFGRCPQPAFAQGLELGAGDGFQSSLLRAYVAALIATDYRPTILDAEAHAGVTYRVCDAERVDEMFAAEQFDLIFSSNMLEHLPAPQRALAGMRRVLRDDGIAIHIVPSPFWKVCHLLGFYPNAVLSRLDRWLARHRPADAATINDTAWDNNPKAAVRRGSRLRRILWPAPHGISGGHLAEFRAFSPARWRAEFAAAGFDIRAIRRGPVSSGYGFGLDALRAFLERRGLASEYAYLVVKTGRTSPHLAHLLPEQTPADPGDRTA